MSSYNVTLKADLFSILEKRVTANIVKLVEKKNYATLSLIQLRVVTSIS